MAEKKQERQKGIEKRQENTGRDIASIFAPFARKVALNTRLGQDIVVVPLRTLWGIFALRVD